MKTLLVINPGATSTKIAVFLGDELKLDETVQHLGEDLGCFERIVDQVQYRLDLILQAMSFTVTNGFLSGTITLQAMGN